MIDEPWMLTEHASDMVLPRFTNTSSDPMIFARAAARNENNIVYVMILPIIRALMPVIEQATVLEQRVVHPILRSVEQIFQSHPRIILPIKYSTREFNYSNKLPVTSR